MERASENGPENLSVAVFDRRVTGEALSNSELELTFHLLEQLGMREAGGAFPAQLAADDEDALAMRLANG